MSVYDAISFMDESQKSKMFEDMDTRIDTMGESTLKLQPVMVLKLNIKIRC